MVSKCITFVMKIRITLCLFKYHKILGHLGIKLTYFLQHNAFLEDYSTEILLRSPQSKFKTCKLRGLWRFLCHSGVIKMPKWQIISRRSRNRYPMEKIDRLFGSNHSPSCKIFFKFYNITFFFREKRSQLNRQ